LEKRDGEFKCISSSFECEHVIKFNNVIPLLTEGQLRRFIEEKTKLKVDIQYGMTDEPHITLHDIATNRAANAFDNLGNDLLFALWQVAIEVVKEMI